MIPFWVSWEHHAELGPFVLRTPWWASGQTFRGGAVYTNICAAVAAMDVEHAKQVIMSSFDDPLASDTQVEWRFVEAKTEGWVPFSDRFRRAEWMEWPPAPTGRPAIDPMTPMPQADRCDCHLHYEADLRDAHARIDFYEAIMAGGPPHCVGDSRPCKLAPAGDTCCNPGCRGLWGTGCWCCHYMQFARQASDEQVAAALESFRRKP